MANKYNITFVDKSDEAKKTIIGLSKTALRASGKVVRKYLRENVPVRSKRFKNHIGTWVFSYLINARLPSFGIVCGFTPNSTQCGEACEGNLFFFLTFCQE